MKKSDVLLVGLPDSGKTTFLAALWFLLFNQEIPLALSLQGLPQHRDYLNKISGKWSRIIQIDHTPVEEFKEISLQLSDGNELVELNVPDMSGETWGSIWATHTCTKKIKQWAQNSHGLMLFLHAGKIRQDLDIMTSNTLVAALGGDIKDQEFVSWLPEMASTQVVLVDILQKLSIAPLGHSGRRLVVNISAWDVASDSGESPSDFFKHHFPLLHQFIHFSGNFSAVKVFGISAQGGDLKSAKDAKKLQAEKIPSNRIKVVDCEKVHHDLSETVKWLMG